MQGAIPGLLEIVEANDAAEVGTDGRDGAGPAIDRRNRHWLTAFGTDYSGALGRRPILLFQRVKLGIKPSLGGRNPHGGVRSEVPDGARRLAHAGPQGARPGRHIVQDFPADSHRGCD